MTVFERQEPGFLATWLEQKGIPPDIAVRKSGIDPDTFWAVYDGSKTLPSFALRMGKNLGMNQEEVQHIGKALDRKVWTRCDNGLKKPYAIEMNSNWYKHLDNTSRKHEADTRAKYFIDRKKVASILIGRDEDAMLFFQKNSGVIRDAGGKALRERIAALEIVANLLGVSVKDISCETFYSQKTTEYRTYPVWVVDPEKLEACRAKSGFSFQDAAKRYLEKTESRCKAFAIGSKCTEAWNRLISRFSLPDIVANQTTLLALEYAVNCDRRAFATQDIQARRSITRLYPEDKEA